MIHISRIDDLHQFDRLRESWTTVYEADPHATIFVSWPWLRGWFAATPHKWLVLVGRSDTSPNPVAFFPLALDGHRLLMGGNPLADYTGLVCVPQHEAEAIAGFATYVQRQVDWEKFYLRNVLDGRIDRFFKHFAVGRFALQVKGQTSCPHICLPDTWEKYLQECVGPTTSRDIKRSLKKIATGDQFRVTSAEVYDLDTHVETLLDHWHARWGCPDYYRAGFREIFRHCFEHDRLWLSILWDGTKLIGALAALLDPVKKIMTACITSSDRTYAQLRPGKMVYAYAIRYAIEHGYRIFDFTRGNEGYKFSLGAVERFSPSLTIARTGLPATARKFVRRLRSAWLGEDWISARQGYLESARSKAPTS
jgi:CelD/BcsL family acetyltransferase involved in cellulose biosynthesis